MGTGGGARPGRVREGERGHGGSAPGVGPGAVDASSQDAAGAFGVLELDDGEDGGDDEVEEVEDDDQDESLEAEDDVEVASDFFAASAAAGFSALPLVERESLR